MNNVRHVTSFLEDLQLSRKIETWSLNIAKLNNYVLQNKPASYSDLVSCVYEFYGESRGRTFTKWGDKNNFYLHHIGTLKKLFPDAFFIHIVRDGRDVACSYMRLNKKKIVSQYAPNLPCKIEDIAYEWVGNIREIRESFNLINWDNTLEIKYEDLVANPESKLKELCWFIGEEYDPSMLEYFVSQLDEPADFLQWKDKLLEKPSSSQVGAYRRELSGNDIALFKSIAHEILSAYFYD